MSCSHHHGQSSATAGYPVSNPSAGAKWSKGLTQSRLGQFLGGHFSGENLSSALFTHKVDSEDHVKLSVWSAPGLSKPTFEEALKQKFTKAKKGDRFGPSWTNHWWKVEVKIPEYWKQYERVQFEFDPGCEAMIYDLKGTPLQGITGGYGGDRRVEYIIPPSAREKGTHSFIIESSCNGMFGVPWNGDTIAPPDMNRYFTLDSADLVVPNQEAWRLLSDFQTLRELVDTLPGNTPLQNLALTTANAIMNAFQSGSQESITAARKLAERVFGQDWEKTDFSSPPKGDAPAIWGIGHCHIDSAWLWPYSVTQQKVARSWSTQVDLIERYDEFCFGASTAQQYKWLEQLYPRLFDRVKEKVLDGRFHILGGSWVENDSNMPSGEALVRQFLYGQRYFQSRFGKRCETGWLPDSFGLTGALPQLMRLAGMKYFFTQKLSWNNINVFPHSTFNWVGIDGTQVLCHMTPVDTYTAQASVGDVNKGQTNHKNLESNADALLVYGNGDGGGGPLSKMIENLRRIRAVNENHRELPKIKMGHTVEQFFEHIETKTNAGAALPNWHGELYLEFHRGTYTSHGSIKRGNRKSEILMRDVEHVATAASLISKDYLYPKSKIDECWEKLLLNQFHDVLPGSAIGMVYDDAEKLYAEIKKDGEALLEAALKVLYPRSSPVDLRLPLPTALATSGALIGHNTTPFQRRDIIPLPLGGAGAALKNKVVQTSSDGTIGYALMESEQSDEGRVRSACRGMFADCKPTSVYTNGSDHFVLRNSSVQLTISKGRIVSLLDVELERELIPEGETGGLVIFEDRPNYWDAWDVEIHHLEKKRELQLSNIKVVAEGPLRASVAAEVKYGKSTIKVTISLDAIPASYKKDSRSLFIFDASVDWRQRHEFLKFQVPLNIHNTNATYETQFGYVQRPTHKNTTWDIAKFEVCGHKYADLSEYGYGVAILSESKYGFSCLGNVLSISLLRAATAPDAEQDQGAHRFSWALMPHAGSFLESDVPTAAYLFNSPLHIRHIPKEASDSLVSAHTSPFAIKNSPNVILETIKRGENDDFSKPVDKVASTTLILRVFEAFGGHAHARLELGHHAPIEKAFITNVLEDETEELKLFSSEHGGTYVQLNFHGFEVKTVKLVLKKIGDKAQVLPKRESWVSIDKAVA